MKGELVAYRADGELRERMVANLAQHVLLPTPAGDSRRAAVAVTVVEGHNREACFLLTRRAQSLRAHPGQWALPGGRLEPDERPEEAALRELEEEVGLSLRESQVLGRLDDYPTRSGYAIAPIVLWGGAASDLAPNADEVASVHRFPLALLDGAGLPRLLAGIEARRPIIQMSLGDHGFVHAPTAAVLYQFREVALHGRPARVAHFDQPDFAWG